MSEDVEIWSKCPSFPRYEASSLGRIRSLFFRGIKRDTPFIMKQGINIHGRYMVRVYLFGKSFNRSVHSLVCEAFNGKRPTGMQCAHGNGIRTDNRCTNLRWATGSENQHDRKLHGTACLGSRNARSTLCEKNVIEIRKLISIGLGDIEISKRFPVTRSAIASIRNGVSWKWLK